MIRGGEFWGRYWGGQKWQNLKSIFEKTRVGFGSPELSLRLSCTEFSALSSGHGPRDLGSWGFFRGGFLHLLGDFFLGGLFGGVENGKT